MDLTSDKKISLKELQDFVTTASPDDLAYLLGRYGGPHNLILREKKFEYEAAKKLTYLINMKYAEREIDSILSE